MPKRWKNWRFLTQDAPLSLNVFSRKTFIFSPKIVIEPRLRGPKLSLTPGLPDFS
jgi:hypothetical protein